jgi:hypothetical protein
VIADRYANSNVVREPSLRGIAERATHFVNRCYDSVGGSLDIFVSWPSSLPFLFFSFLLLFGLGFELIISFLRYVSESIVPTEPPVSVSSIADQSVMLSRPTLICL